MHVNPCDKLFQTIPAVDSKTRGQAMHANPYDIRLRIIQLVNSREEKLGMHKDGCEISLQIMLVLDSETGEQAMHVNPSDISLQIMPAQGSKNSRASYIWYALPQVLYRAKTMPSEAKNPTSRRGISQLPLLTGTGSHVVWL